MATLLALLILSVCLEACTANTSSSGSKALACSAGNFTAGDNAKVICYFPTDVNATMQHVYVTWYPFNTIDIYKDVITCFRRRNGLLKCDVMDGYKYNNVISNTLIFVIPEITQDFAGRYSCSLVPPSNPPPDLCTLHVNTPPEIPSGNFVNHSSFPETDRPIFENIVNNLIVANVLLAVLLVAGVLGFVFTVKYMQKRTRGPMVEASPRTVVLQPDPNPKVQREYTALPQSAPTSIPIADSKELSQSTPLARTNVRMGMSSQRSMTAGLYAVSKCTLPASPEKVGEENPFAFGDVNLDLQQLEC